MVSIKLPETHNTFSQTQMLKPFYMNSQRVAYKLVMFVSVTCELSFISQQFETEFRNHDIVTEGVEYSGFWEVYLQVEIE